MTLFGGDVSSGQWRLFPAWQVQPCWDIAPGSAQRHVQTQITRSIQSLGWPGKPNYALYIIMSESPVIKEVESNFDSANKLNIKLNIS